ncbi:MAG: oxidoreductase, partial [Flavobacteriaceae bacterium]|nr:oxidoreductase [Flavobacteriaceae bacterium]
MRFVLFLTVLSLLSGCSNTNDSTFKSVSVEQIYTDSLSIRAIAPVSENAVWFAADKGMVGLIDSGVPKLANIRYEDQPLHFRAIAATPSAVFVLSVATPGVLYKIGHENNEATSIEEVYTEVGEKVFYDSMAFWNAKEGIAMGDPIGGCLSIIVTRDGGATWKKLPCTVLPAVEEGEAAFAASNSNIAIVNDQVWIATGGKRARVFHSPDKGETWEVFETPIIQGKAMTGIYSIDFYNENRGIVFGGNWDDKESNEGNKAITNDGGKTWQLLSNGKG